MQQQTQQMITDTGAATSVGAASVAWLAQINEVMQFIAYAVAIVSGCIAIYGHFARKRNERTKTKR